MAVHDRHRHVATHFYPRVPRPDAGISSMVDLQGEDGGRSRGAQEGTYLLYVLRRQTAPCLYKHSDVLLPTAYRPLACNALGCKFSARLFSFISFLLCFLLRTVICVGAVIDRASGC